MQGDARIRKDCKNNRAHNYELVLFKLEVLKLQQLRTNIWHSEKAIYFESNEGFQVWMRSFAPNKFITISTLREM